MDQHTDPQFRTTHEHVKFPDGSHVIVHSSPGRVQVTGYVAGEWIEYAGPARDAQEQARLLDTEAPDALWTLPAAMAGRIATAMDGAVTAAHVEAPEDDSSESLPAPTGSERIPLDGGHADLEVIDQHVEVTVTLGGRATVGLALSPVEADRIGTALRDAAHRAHTVQAAQVDLEGVETITDLWHRAQETGIPASALIEQVGL